MGGKYPFDLKFNWFPKVASYIQYAIFIQQHKTGGGILILSVAI